MSFLLLSITNIQHCLLIFSQFNWVIRNFCTFWSSVIEMRAIGSRELLPSLTNSSAQASVRKCQTQTGCFLRVHSVKCRKDEQKLLGLFSYLTERWSSLKPEFKPMLRCSGKCREAEAYAEHLNFLYETCPAMAPFSHTASASTPKLISTAQPKCCSKLQ